MDFSIDNFARTLKRLMYEFMPFESDGQMAIKHPTRNFHMRDIALGHNAIIPLGTDSVYFEIGNEESEEKAPYYHILQDAQVIRKKGFATKKTKGSQAFITDPKKRDYGQASYSVTYDKKGRRRVNAFYEYRRNVRGKRSLVGKASQRVFSQEDGKMVRINRESKYYVNIHFDYIGRNLENIVKILCNEFDMEFKSVRTNYLEEYIDYNDEKYMINDTYFDDEDF